LKILVCGAGWCGSLLSNKLTEYGDVEVYERNRKPTAICGCGIPTSFFVQLAKSYGLNPEDYILWKAHEIMLSQGKKVRHIPIDNLCTFDKQKFMEDLINQSSATFHFGKKLPESTKNYDLIIDASGKRALLGKLPTDMIIPCFQVKASFNKLPYPDFYADFSDITSTSYLWMFPLSDREANVGCGAPKGRYAYNRVMEFIKEHDGEIIQRQAKPVRIAPPHESLPFYRDNIIGVGESIGAITGFGEGNAFSAITVELLLENLEDTHAYSKAVLDELNWLKTDHAFIQSMIHQRKTRMIYYAAKIAGVYKRRLGVNLRKLFL